MSGGKHTQGFTIVELLIVVVVIAILAAITIVSYTGINSRTSTAAVAEELSQNSKTIMNAVTVTGTNYLASSIKTSGLDATKFKTTDYRVITYCASVTEFVLLVETTAGKKFYSKNGTAMVRDDSLNSFQPCGTLGVGGAYTTYLNLPSLCAVENGTCTVTGTATVVYGSSAQGRFNYLTNQSGTVSCSNATFTDPVSGSTKACYVYPN
jgi:prepilin-type N-terminal cleavage/methylation domain-containing protein